MERLLARLRTSVPSGRARIAASRWILRGAFPELWAKKGVDSALWTAGYIETYLERDVRSVLRVGDLGAFHTFLRLAAARTGRLLSLSDLARDAGVSHTTARNWISILEASHQVFLLRPHFANFGKRLVKAPKLYWLDTGLACSLVGLTDEKSVANGPMAGALFETAVVAEFVKAFRHRGEIPPIWFWRSADGLEVDLLVDRKGHLLPIEVKFTATPRPEHAASIVKWRAGVGPIASDGFVIANVAASASLVPGVRSIPWDFL